MPMLMMPCSSFSYSNTRGVTAGSIRTVASIEDKADYSVEKDAIEGIRLQAVKNINKYQAKTIKWRD
jgi:hypothetical protein